MNEIELFRHLHTLNDEELFYKKYQDEKKLGKESFSNYINNLDIDYCVNNHFVIPEIKQTMPPSMKDEYFYSEPDVGMVIQKHNCYSPAFEHFHTYFEAFYVYEGTCEHTIDNQTKTLKMGDFCIIPPGVSHKISVMDQSIIIVMILSSQVIENTFKNPTFYKDNLLAEFFMKNIRFSSDNDYLMFHTGNDNELKNIIIQMMLESTNKYQEYDAILSAYFSLFFGKLIRYYEDTIDVPKNNNERFTAAFEITTYIQEHHTDINLSKLAERYHYTPEYTSRYIKETTGKTFSEILIDSRMKHAISLLKSTSLPIAEVAYLVGYENTENFIRTFKNRYDKTPTAYRKELIKEYTL